MPRAVRRGEWLISGVLGDENNAAEGRFQTAPWSLFGEDDRHPFSGVNARADGATA